MTKLKIHPSNVLTDLEQKWYDRLVLMAAIENRTFICSWWLREEYQNETIGKRKINTTDVNKILSGIAKKGFLTREAKPNAYTKFHIIQKQSK